VLEGVRLCEEALGADVSFRGVVAAPALRRTQRGSRLLAALRARAIEIEEVPDETLATLADTESPQGVVAVVELPEWRLEDVEPGPHQPVVVLDGVQDPGNVGTICRTAYALGAAGVVFLPGTVVRSNPKVLRGSMGATLRFPTPAVTVESLLSWLATTDVALWATAADGVPIQSFNPPDRLAILVGNEGAGISPALRAAASRIVGVPLVRPAESINAAVAAGIILYEVVH